MQARARRVGFASVTAFEAIDSKEFSVRTPAADLEVAVTSPPGTVHAGTSLSVSEVVRNVGVASSSSCTLSYALDSVVIGSRVVPALAPGTESAATVTLPVPARTGAFYLTLQHNCTSDLSVWNNLTSIAVRVIP
jgi:subtilase family serine protease